MTKIRKNTGEKKKKRTLEDFIFFCIIFSICCMGKFLSFFFNELSWNAVRSPPAFICLEKIKVFRFEKTNKTSLDFCSSSSLKHSNKIILEYTLVIVLVTHSDWRERNTCLSLSEEDYRIVMVFFITSLFLRDFFISLKTKQ